MLRSKKLFQENFVSGTDFVDLFFSFLVGSIRVLFRFFILQTSIF